MQHFCASRFLLNDETCCMHFCYVIYFGGAYTVYTRCMTRVMQRVLPCKTTLRRVNRDYLRAIAQFLSAPLPCALKGEGEETLPVSFCAPPPSPFLNGNQLLMERICSFRSIFFPLRVVSHFLRARSSNKAIRNSRKLSPLVQEAKRY